MSTSNTKSQERSKDLITALILELEDWSSDINQYKRTELDTSGYFSEETYQKVLDSIKESSERRNKIIRQIQTLLEKSAGIE